MPRTANPPIRPRGHRPAIRWAHLLAALLLALALASRLLIGQAPHADAQVPRSYAVSVGNDGLRVRAAPGTSARVVGGLFPGDRVRIACTATGPAVRGPFGVSNIWDRIGNGRWVSDAFVKTGSDAAVAPACNQNPTPQERREQAEIDRNNNRSEPHYCPLTDNPADVRNLLMGTSCELSPEMRSDYIDQAYVDDGHSGAQVGALSVTDNHRDLGSLPRPLHTEHVDGCTKSPDQPGGLDFRDACATHDFGYRLIDRHLLPKSAKPAVDRTFLDVMNAICNTQYYRHRWDLPNKLRCREMAYEYYVAVKYRGHPGE